MSSVPLSGILHLDSIMSKIYLFTHIHFSYWDFKVWVFMGFELQNFQSSFVSFQRFYFQLLIIRICQEKPSVLNYRVSFVNCHGTMFVSFFLCHLYKPYFQEFIHFLRFQINRVVSNVASVTSAGSIELSPLPSGHEKLSSLLSNSSLTRIEFIIFAKTQVYR